MPNKKNMAYKTKTKKGYSVKKGNSGKTLKSFSGKGAEKRACDYVTKLHNENKPLAKNRGKAAQKRNQK